MEELALSVDRLLDAEIASLVMGLEHRDWVPYGAPEGLYPRSAPRCNARDSNGNAIDADGYLGILPYYSTDMANAWEVVGKMRELGWGIILNDTRGQYRARFWRLDCVDNWNIFSWVHTPDNAMTVWADTATRAICLAALRAVHEAK